VSENTRRNIVIDVAIFAAFILAMAPRVTGVAVHEWLSVALAATLLVHLALHWDWLREVLRRFFSRLAHESRLNLIVDLALFLAFVAVMASGLANSRVALPSVGLDPGFSLFWKRAHTLSTDLAIVALGVHAGLHAKWIWRQCRKFLLDPVAGLFRPKAATGGQG
jgi:hypothetical protein